MSKYTITITKTYHLRGQRKKDYLEWLDDYEDTEAMRKWFLLDQFMPIDYTNKKSYKPALKALGLDASATVTYTKEDN